MIQTHWQPSYTPRRYVTECVPVVWDEPLTQRVYDYLEENGITSNNDLAKAFHIKVGHLSHIIARMGSRVEREISGNRGSRLCTYWVKTNPPKTSQRCVAYRAVEWFRENPWHPSVMIPDDIHTTVKGKKQTAVLLEKKGLLTSKLQDGVKLYKAVS